MEINKQRFPESFVHWKTTSKKQIKVSTNDPPYLAAIGGLNSIWSNGCFSMPVLSGESFWR